MPDADLDQAAAAIQASAFGCAGERCMAGAGAVPVGRVADALVERVSADPDAGVAAACEQVVALRESGACDGVHFVPVSRYRQVAIQLERLL